MKKTSQQPTQDFFVTNISNRNVTLADLAINIPAFRTVNLMDTKHYSYTFRQLQKSAESGSLFNKRDKISVRKVDIGSAGIRNKNHLLIENKMTTSEDSIQSRERSTLVIKDEEYEELQISDEDFASESAEMDSQK